MAGSCVGFLEPLNLRCQLLNRFAGTPDIFFFIAFIVIAMMCAKFKMRTGPSLIILAIFGLLFSQFIPWITILIMLVGGVIILFALQKPFSR